MKLSELNPTLEGTVASGHLEFNCPFHPTMHTISIPIGAYSKRAWEASGEFPDTLTTSPSILPYNGSPLGWEDIRDPDLWKKMAECGAHFFIRNGEIVNA